MIQTPDQSFSRAAFTMPARARYCGHAHENWHLLWVRSGDFEEADGDHGFSARAGQFRLSRGGVAHTLTVGSGQSDVINFHVRDPRLAARLGRSFTRDHSLFDCLPEDEGLAGLEGLELEETLFALLPRLERQARDEDPLAEDWLREARMRLARSGDPVSVIARDFGLSREHFSRAYARAFGVGPRQTRKYATLRHALHLIETTDVPLSDVALEAGFYDQGHMSNAVRAKLGRTPLQLRRAA